MDRISKFSVVLLLPFMLTLLRVVADGTELHLRRQKRTWNIPPAKLWENKDYRRYESIFKIQSDKEYTSKVFYSLRGSGADLYPMGLFTINTDTGLVQINGILDREEIPFYKLQGVAKFSNGVRAEEDLEVTVVVRDQNDCPPVFAIHQSGSVYESSASGTVVMRVNATDADEANTLHSQIYFSIVQKSSSDRMFYMNYQTGEIMVSQTTLDRETQDTYTLTVMGADMNGAPSGNSASAEVVIKLLDINDNIPTLEKESYEGSVTENTINVEVLRIKALDLDLMYSDNWLAVFSFVSGNEAGYFSITTNAETNEGILVINKPLDYEELKVLNLAVSVSNKAEYNFGFGGGAGGNTGKTYQIKINVINQREGPRFQPPIKVVTISEDSTTVIINQVITNYAAIDSDTLQIATNVRYAKVYDVGNWLIIDEKTADIKLNKVPDRESNLLINGTYYAKIICITNEVNAKTATGTIAIQVEDFNDHCPTLTSSSQTMCHGDNAVYVTAQDGDPFPNGEPFTFRVVQMNAKEKWAVEYLNATTTILRDHAKLWPGNYRVAMEIKDMHGKVCAEVQWLDVTVCTCDEAKTGCLAWRKSRSATLGVWGVLMLLLGLLLLLLLPLFLLFCLCGGMAAMGNFKAIPFDTKEHLIAYHTEGQGEDKEVPMLQVPVDHGTVQAVDVNKYGEGGQLELGSGSGGDGGVAGGGGFTSFSTSDRYRYHGFGGCEEVDFMGAGAGVGGGTMTGRENVFFGYGAGTGVGTGAYEGIALSEAFLEEYYSSKASHVADRPQPNDALLIYDYEGQGSPVGSVGCCSLLDNDNDLDFLDDLGPKFKTLAEICRGSATETEESVSVSVSPPGPPAAAFATVHSETVNTLNSSASSSSALFRDVVLSERASAAVPRVRVQEGVVVPGPTLLVQQPAMYYSAAPMYVVEPQPQVMLLEMRAAGVGAQHVVGQMGLGQGLVQVGGPYGSQEGVLLVERQVGAHAVTGASHAIAGGGHVVTGGVHTLSGGVQVLQGAGPTMVGAAHVAAGPAFSHGAVSKSRQVLVVESGSSSQEHGPEVKGHCVTAAHQSGSSLSSSSQTGSVGSNKDSAVAVAPSALGSHRVLVQHKKISVTERNVETSSVA